MNEEQQAYFHDMYAPVSWLASQSGLAEEQIEGLVAAQCIPGASYEIRHREEAYAYINDEINTLSVSTTGRHFSRDIVHLLGFIKPRIESDSLEQTSRLMKARVRKEFQEGLKLHQAESFAYLGLYQQDGDLDEQRFAAHFEDYIWPHWVHGTWGICVYGSHLGQNIARKTVAVERVRALTDNGAKSSYTDSEARAVRTACDEYNEIVPPFSPHDRHDSSRARLVTTALSIIEQQAKSGMNAA